MLHSARGVGKYGWIKFSVPGERQDLRIVIIHRGDRITVDMMKTLALFAVKKGQKRYFLN